MTGSQGDRMLPLAGVTVLDLGQVYQGPYAGFLLAMAGARVIKVEPPRGELLRARGPSLPYAMLNSCKETVTVNLKEPRGVELFHELSRHADAVVLNYAPGVPERLGIGFGDLIEVNPRIVYAHACAFGLDREVNAPGMDITVQAHMGAMAVTGHPGSPPVKAGIAFVDFLGGAHLYGAITSALYERERTGIGRSVEVVMADAAYMTLATCLTEWQNTGKTPRRGNKHPAGTLSPYDVYPCADGHFALITISDKQWTSLLDVIGQPELAFDLRFLHTSDRAQNVAAVDDLVANWSSTRSRAEVVTALQRAHVLAAAVRDLDEVVHDEDAIDRRAIQWIEHPDLGEMPLPHSPIRWHDSELLAIDPSHPVGADNAVVFGELLGMSESDLTSLKAAAVI